MKSWKRLLIFNLEKGLVYDFGEKHPELIQSDVQRIDSNKKKLLTRTVDHYRNRYEESLTATCRLFGVSRQVYYRNVASMHKEKQRAQKVLDLVQQIRIEQPRIGTRKLYYLLEDKLKALQVERDCLFSILRANHMLISPKRQYHITTHSHHRFRKHKNLIDSETPTRPEQVWVADITYLGTRDKPMHLALITTEISDDYFIYSTSGRMVLSSHQTSKIDISTLATIQSKTR